DAALDGDAHAVPGVPFDTLILREADPVERDPLVDVDPNGLAQRRDPVQRGPLDGGADAIAEPAAADDLREVVIVELVEAAEDVRRRPGIEAAGGDRDLGEEDLLRAPETDARAGDERVVVVRRDLGALAARGVEPADLAVDPVHRPRVDEQLPQGEVPRRVAAADPEVVPPA